ncbi:short-chain type dehydrogenase reductase [Fusarium langsethiae]|uniref:Short-chain type dehydrogenase reductase n=1 Tax=Fusarium langsethiae TaxID=179993 RepID=A0A0N0DAG3_FUSLA|nr:short-chain type dehydrogenase reductase [Fusarium langsethiae]
MGYHTVNFVPTLRHTTYPSIAETNPELSADGKIVFITGGGQGIGRQIAKSFLTAEAKGIFLIGRNETTLKDAVSELDNLQESKSNKTTLHYAKTDVTDTDAVASAFRQAIEVFGHIDILIQNAGYLDDHLSVSDSDLNDYWRTFEVNVKGALELGHLPYLPGYSAYSASKLGFAKIMEYVQHEHPDLRVFSIQPGAVETAMQSKSGIPAVDDISLPASYCVWLAGSKDADSLKGRFLWTNWDVDELKGRVDEIKEKNLLVHGLNGW